MPLRRESLVVAAVVAGVAAYLVQARAGEGETNAPSPSKASRIKVETLAHGLQNPWALQFLPDGRQLVTERPGRMRLIAGDGTLSEPVAGSPPVVARGQGGLLDVALAPDFASSGTIYFSYAEPRDGDKNGTTLARAKLVLDGTGGRLEGVSVLFRQQPAIASHLHFGSRIVFNPDGTLFLTTGDRGNMRDQAQNPAGHLGKMIRLNLDGSVPADNPKLPGWAPEVWSIGHRNSQGAALDPKTGRLWTIEHGARGGDELNHPEAGKNYGWPVITYGRDYTFLPIGEGTAKEGMEQPVYYWDPSIAVSGLAFYTGDLFPEWKGNIFVGGLGGEHLARLVIENGRVAAHEKLLADVGERIRDVRSGPDGALWLLTDDARDGKLLRITPGR
ncbi:MAG: PQQ-dependent sugar dehydrogenase [Hyphomicrobium sp.]